MLDRNAQPQIIVLTNRKILIEPAELFEEIFCHHDRRRAHQAKLQAAPKYIAGRLLVFALRVDPDPASYPDFFGLANLNLRMLPHESSLNLKFSGQPKIVRIEKRDGSSAGNAHAEIPRRGHSPSSP